jgi:glycosyltransferase involved in cell wall biosynthesis
MVHGARSEVDAPAHVAVAARLADDAQKLAASTCHAMVCVSQEMKRDVVARWQAPEARISVIPCCTDVAAGERALAGRDAARARLGLAGRFVVAYCGSLEAWQMPEASLAAFGTISALRDDAHFLAITTHPERMKVLVEAAGVSADRRTILSVPHTEVASHLACADVGLLIREDSPVNRVASPVKFAEYLSCGVPVVLSQGIGDYSTLVDREAVGCVLPFPGRGDPRPALAQFLERQSRDPEGIRRACVSVAREHFDWSVGTRRLDAMYAAIQAEASGP